MKKIYPWMTGNRKIFIYFINFYVVLGIKHMTLFGYVFARFEPHRL